GFLFLGCLLKSVFCSAGDSLEDGITASRAEVFSSEELTVTLSCNYSVRAENLQWYRQDPGSAPRFLLLITDTKEPSVVEAKPPNPRQTAVLNQERNQVHLQISSAAVTDSAVYYCALQPTVTGNNTTLYKNLQRKHNTPQRPLEGVTHCERTSVTLSYKYPKLSTSDYFYWYRQFQGKPPEFLISHLGSKATLQSLDPRFSHKVKDDDKLINLQISSAAVTDSAVYYCAVTPTVTGNNKTLYNILQTKHKTTQHPLEGNTH
uniref:Ig-like domain-containing protein n=1 Tax=Oryzias latipes TaxID=8090 RepID=A0A3B3H6W4_ORYLA